MVASGIVDAQTWVEEPLTRNAFLTVIARQYIIGGDPNERLAKLFEESVAAAEEITEALGAQVRRAVELLIQAFDEVCHRAPAPRSFPIRCQPTRTTSTQAAVTVMMRVVFLLFAEERGLLPQSELFLQGYGISGDLDALEHRDIGDGEESLDSTYLTWHRLLATSQALYQRRVSFENMRMPAYGGSLFDPDRFTFLTASNEHSTLALPVSDRVMLHVLRSVQVAQLKGGDARRISFRDIDVEQIGYIYEGLLGYTCTRVGDIHVGLIGTAGSEPEDLPHPPRTTRRPAQHTGRTRESDHCLAQRAPARRCRTQCQRLGQTPHHGSGTRTPTGTYGPSLTTKYSAAGYANGPRSPDQTFEAAQPSS